MLDAVVITSLTPTHGLVKYEEPIAGKYRQVLDSFSNVFDDALILKWLLCSTQAKLWVRIGWEVKLGI